MQRIKIIFAGGRKLGVKVLKWLCDHVEYDVIGVCTLEREFDPYSADEMNNIICSKDLPKYSIDDLLNADFDVGLSVNYNKIISEKILLKPKIGFFNVHHSYNLRLRGRNITTHAILESVNENIFYHGTTLHKMVPSLDAGPIVASASCRIENNDTAFSLFNKADNLAFDLICDWMPRICFQEVFMYDPPTEGVRYYKNKDLPSKEIMIDLMDKDMIFDHVRAFDFAGYEPAYYFRRGEKCHLVIYKRDSYVNEIIIKDHLYYTDKAKGEE